MVWDPRHINLQNKHLQTLCYDHVYDMVVQDLAQAAQRGVIVVYAVLCMAAPFVAYLEHGVVCGLQPVGSILLAQSCLQVCIVWGWQGHSRE